MKTKKLILLACLLCALFSSAQAHCGGGRVVLVPERIHYVAGQGGRINLWLTVWVPVFIPFCGGWW